ncbi:hypothetical protein J3Q64DRAFT_1744326 [Phycomyces blakesleeanus]|uniref:Uncharacterized protein n=1 Tax=Phycomyces blakesleeanus TaxID=4837 RepID=A0ABR3AYV9_PHYBL
MYIPNQSRFQQEKKQSRDLVVQRPVHQQEKDKKQQKKSTNSSGQTLRFAKVVAVRETYSAQEYDRSSDPEAVCVHLSATLAQYIKEELNTYKLQEMKVHEHSRVHTHFFL